MSTAVEVLCLGFDPAELGLTELGQAPRPVPDGVTPEFSTALDRGSVRQAFLRPERWDLLLCLGPALQGLGVDRWLKECADRVDASLILLRADGTELTPGDAARLGAADVVAQGDREHLRMVMARERAVAGMRRQLRELKAGSPVGRGAVLMPKISDFGRSARFQRRARAAAAVEGADAAAAATLGAASVDERVKRLIEAGGLTLEYQPIVRLHQDRGQQPAMFEALLRLRDDAGELLAPGSFFPAASRHQWLGKLDLWVFRRALPVLHTIQQSGPAGTRLFVNLSADTLGSPDVVEAIAGAIRSAAITDGSLTVDLSTQAMRHDPQAFWPLDQALRERGHKLLLERVRLEDLELLQAHAERLSYVKLHPALIQDIASGQVDQEELRRLLRSARHHGIQVIALAVDNADVLPALYALGVDFIQGHFVSMPYEELVYPDAFSIEIGPGVAG